MRYNVAQLLKEPTGSSRRYDLREDIEGIDADLVMKEPLVGQIEMIRTAEGILVRGTLTTAAEVECSRCLEPFVERIEFDIDEEFHPSVDIHTGVALPWTEEATRIDESHTIDLTEIVRQNIFLALSMRPICRPDCAGLCPQCGKNLNEGPCSCQEEALDPCLEMLRVSKNGRSTEKEDL